MWIVTALLANAIIVTIEYTYRTQAFAWSAWLLVGLALRIAFMQWCLWYTWHNAPSLLTAWAVFTTGNLVLRIVNAALFVGEPLSLMTTVGVACVAMGVVFTKMGA